MQDMADMQPNSYLHAALRDMLAGLEATLKETQDDLDEQVEARIELSDELEDLNECMKKFNIQFKTVVTELKMTKVKLAAAHHTMARMERAACKRYKRRIAAARQRSADLARMVAKAKAHGAI
jgi:chromosome segregation ATPase